MDKRLKKLRTDIEPLLREIEKFLPESYRITLVARNIENKDADVILTMDNLKKAAESILILDKTQTKGKNKDERG